MSNIASKALEDSTGLSIKNVDKVTDLAFDVLTEGPIDVVYDYIFKKFDADL